jgi:hypothetical protein
MSPRRPGTQGACEPAATRSVRERVPSETS